MERGEKRRKRRGERGAKRREAERGYDYEETEPGGGVLKKRNFLEKCGGLWLVMIFSFKGTVHLFG